MTTIRVKRRDRWTTIDRQTINDERLSFKALGLLIWLLDKPDDWRIDSEAIGRQDRKEGRDAVRTALRELEDCGYLKRTRSQGRDGRWITESEISEVSDQVTPEAGYPSSVEPASAEPPSGGPASAEPTSDDPALIQSTDDRELLPSTETDHGVPTSLTLVPPSPARVDPVQQVFDAWIEAARRTGKTQLSPKRRRLIAAALKAYPIDDVLDAVRGWLFSEFHCGENGQRKVYNEIELLLRDAEHIEQFRDLARNSRPTPGRRTPQSWSAIAEAVEAKNRERGVG